MSEDQNHDLPGDYPDGKLNDEDEGALQFGIADQDGNIIINFFKPVRWIAMPPEEAAKLAGVLIRRARKVAKQRGVILEIGL
jgi:hypothetical protein